MFICYLFVKAPIRSILVQIPFARHSKASLYRLTSFKLLLLHVCFLDKFLATKLVILTQNLEGEFSQKELRSHYCFRHKGNLPACFSFNKNIWEMFIKAWTSSTSSISNRASPVSSGMVQRQGKYYFIRLVVQLGSLFGSVPLTNSLEMLVGVSSLMAGSSFKMCLQKTQIHEVSEMVKIWSSFMYFMIYMALSESIVIQFLCLCLELPVSVGVKHSKSSEVAVQKLRRSTGFIPSIFRQISQACQLDVVWRCYQFLKTHNVWSLIFASHPIIPNICYLQDSLEAKSWPICSMYGTFTYIWLIFMVNVCKYTIHGS